MGQQAPTIKAYLSGVRQLQIERGFPDPGIGNMPRLKQIVRGVGVSRGREGLSHPRSRLPITPNILRRLKCVWIRGDPKVDHDKAMLWATACVTFFTFSRSGEMTVPEGSTFDHRVHLFFTDVSIDKALLPNVVCICLKRSKTDQAC